MQIHNSNPEGHNQYSNVSKVAAKDHIHDTGKNGVVSYLVNKPDSYYHRKTGTLEAVRGGRLRLLMQTEDKHGNKTQTSWHFYPHELTLHKVTPITNRELPQLEYLVQNLSNAKYRHETLNGRKHIVVPMTMIVPGVLNGSKGSLFYPEEEVGKDPTPWNGMPITVYHPIRNGKNVSAKTDGILDEQGIGEVRKAKTDGKLRAEAWIDIDKANKVDPRVIQNIQRGLPTEISTGLYTKNSPAPKGSHHNGKPYEWIAREYRPDHLAILPDQKGACSVNDGCGLGVNAEVDEEPIDNDWAKSLFPTGEKEFVLKRLETNSNPEGHNQWTHGGVTVHFSGDTFKAKASLKDKGFKYDGDNKRWSKDFVKGQHPLHVNSLHDAKGNFQDTPEGMHKTIKYLAKSDKVHMELEHHPVSNQELEINSFSDYKCSGAECKMKSETANAHSELADKTERESDHAKAARMHQDASAAYMSHESGAKVDKAAEHSTKAAEHAEKAGTSFVSYNEEHEEVENGGPGSGPHPHIALAVAHARTALNYTSGHHTDSDVYGARLKNAKSGVSLSEVAQTASHSALKDKTSLGHDKAAYAHNEAMQTHSKAMVLHADSGAGHKEAYLAHEKARDSHSIMKKFHRGASASLSHNSQEPDMDFANNGGPGSGPHPGQIHSISHLANEKSTAADNATNKFRANSSIANKQTAIEHHQTALSLHKMSKEGHKELGNKGLREHHSAQVLHHTKQLAYLSKAPTNNSDDPEGSSFNSNEEGETMAKLTANQRSQIINKLTSDKGCGCYTANDADYLQSQSDERLNELAINAEEHLTHNEEREEPVAKVMTAQEYMDAAPPEIQQIIANAAEIMRTEKAGIIAKLVANISDAAKKASMTTMLESKTLPEVKTYAELAELAAPKPVENTRRTVYGPLGNTPIVTDNAGKDTDAEEMTPSRFDWNEVARIPGLATSKN